MRDKPAGIVLKLRQADVLQAQGKSVQKLVRQIGVAVQTSYRWRKEYDGMNRDQLKRLAATGGVGRQRIIEGHPAADDGLWIRTGPRGRCEFQRALMSAATA